MLLIAEVAPVDVLADVPVAVVAALPVPIVLALAVGSEEEGTRGVEANVAVAVTRDGAEDE